MISIKRYIALIVGVILVAISYNLFFVPNNLAATGVSGLAIIISKIFPISRMAFIYIVNIILVGISYLVLGKEQTRNTILGSILLPIAMSLTSNIDRIFVVSDIDVLVQAVIGGLLTGYGLGLVFKYGYTTGGTDIVEMIICKVFKIAMSKAMILIEGSIVLFCGFMFGIEHMIYALIIVVIISICSNRYMLGINDDKVLFITSNKDEEIRKFLIDNFHYGVTIMNAQGGYSKKNKKILMCSVKTSFYIKIRDAIKVIDDDAFITVVDSYETAYIDKELRHRKVKI